jgi:predicted Zn-dependent protease
MIDVTNRRRFRSSPLRPTLAALLAGCLAASAGSAASTGRAPEPLPTKPPVDDLYDKSLKAALEALKVYGVWDDAEQLRRVNDLGYRVAQESGFRDYPLTFGLIDMPEPNAFALPAGQIFVTRGMIALGLTDDELAALLGHEIAHVVHRHGVKIERRATLLNVLSQALMLGVLIGASQSDPDYHPQDPFGRDRVPDSSGELVYGSYAASLILSELLLRSYSREFEDEADEDGQRWAAAAGFAPDGAAGLMTSLGSRLPESKEYGYWRTHPFFAQRVVAAKARGEGLARGQEKPANEFRSWSQRKVLDLGANLDSASEGARLVEAFALAAWPKGSEAERLRLDRIHRERDATIEKIALDRDYGKLLGRYDREIDEVAVLDAASELLPKLRGEREELARQATELLPTARATWRTGIYQTPFLETFLSNWPDAPEVAEVALALGEAYGRTARQADAVAMFLRAAAAAPGTEASERAMRGLRNVAPTLDQLTALGELAQQERDPELAALAAARLEKLAAAFDDVAAGAAFLDRFPESPHVETIAARINVLAENLYGEILLYQSVGDHVRAIDRIQKLLTHAPASPAAQKLLDRVVLPA